MEFEIKSFLELNLIADAVLLLIFSFTVLLRNAKFLLFLLALNLCQYVIWVPDTEILRAHQKLQEQSPHDVDLTKGTRLKPEPASTETLAEDLKSGNAFRMSEGTGKIYDQVLQGLGAGESRASTAMEFSLGAWKKNLTDSEKESEKGLSFSPLDILMQAGRGDLHAAWFLTRFFWLAATIYLYMQRPQIGSTVFAFNLLPIPFLAVFIPYLWFRFNELTWVKDLNAWGEVGTVPKATVDFLVFHGVSFFVLAVPLFLVIVAGMTQWRQAKHTGLRGYLDPARFDLMMNGNRIPFEVHGNQLLAGDFQLNIKQLSYDPENPHIWYLKTGTKVEFVEKG